MIDPALIRPSVLRADSTPHQEAAEAALVQYPYWLELRGKPNELAWPAMCANCGEPSSERVTVKKAFRNWQGDEDGSNGIIGYTIVAARIPLCAACAGQHYRSVKRVSPTQALSTFLFTPAHVSTVGFSVLLVAVVSILFRGRFPEAGLRFGLGIIGVLLFGLLWSVVLAWLITRRHRLEPQTEMSRAVDFSEDLSDAFERARHIYSFRSFQFAQAFSLANRDRHWTADDQSRMRRNSTIVVIIMLALIGAAILFIR
jgi:hypothetical protein